MIGSAFAVTSSFLGSSFTFSTGGGVAIIIGSSLGGSGVITLGGSCLGFSGCGLGVGCDCGLGLGFYLGIFSMVEVTTMHILSIGIVQEAGDELSWFTLEHPLYL